MPAATSIPTASVSTARYKAETSTAIYISRTPARPRPVTIVMIATAGSLRTCAEVVREVSSGHREMRV